MVKLSSRHTGGRLTHYQSRGIGSEVDVQRQGSGGAGQEQDTVCNHLDCCRNSSRDTILESGEVRSQEYDPCVYIYNQDMNERPARATSG